MEKVKELLLELNLDLDSLGVIYWLEVIDYSNEHHLTLTLKDILEQVAKKNDISRYALESYLRRAIDPAQEKIKKKFKYYGKITTKTFLNLLRFVGR